MKVESEIKKWGNSLALRVTGIMADLPGFKDGTPVIVEVNEEGIIVKPAKKVRKARELPYSEADLLQGLTPETAHADTLATLQASEIGN